MFMFYIFIWTFLAFLKLNWNCVLHVIFPPFFSCWCILLSFLLFCLLLSSLVLPQLHTCIFHFLPQTINSNTTCSNIIYDSIFFMCLVLGVLANNVIQDVIYSWFYLLGVGMPYSSTCLKRLSYYKRPLLLRKQNGYGQSIRPSMPSWQPVRRALLPRQLRRTAHSNE